MSTLTENDARRFWGKVDQREPDECWPWLGARDAKDYGWFWLRGTNAGAHRVACAMAHGLAAGRYALHSCDNPPCVNPAHLRWGTQAENVADRDARGPGHAGERNPNARLTRADVVAIRARYAAGESFAALGRAYGVVPQNIRQIVHHELWAHVPSELEAISATRPREIVTHCKHGHEFTPENTYMRNGSRHCRACNRRQAAEYRARRGPS